MLVLNPRCWTSCRFHLLSVMDSADNFNAFSISEVNPGCFKSSFPGACEVVVTTKTRIHCKRALYYVITQMDNFGETHALEIEANDFNSLLPWVYRIKIEDEALVNTSRDKKKSLVCCRYWKRKVERFESRPFVPPSSLLRPSFVPPSSLLRPSFVAFNQP